MRGLSTIPPATPPPLPPWPSSSHADSQGRQTTFHFQPPEDATVEDVLDALGKWRKMNVIQLTPDMTIEMGMEIISKRMPGCRSASGRSAFGGGKGRGMRGLP